MLTPSLYVGNSYRDVRSHYVNRDKRSFIHSCFLACMYSKEFRIGTRLSCPPFDTPLIGKKLVSTPRYG